MTADLVNANHHPPAGYTANTAQNSGLEDEWEEASRDRKKGIHWPTAEEGW